jgi:hypothetical protein
VRIALWLEVLEERNAAGSLAGVFTDSLLLAGSPAAIGLLTAPAHSR